MIGRLQDPRTRIVLTTFLVATVLLLIWRFGLATTGGDIAAQDAWAEFARLNPGSASHPRGAPPSFGWLEVEAGKLTRWSLGRI